MQSQEFDAIVPMFVIYNCSCAYPIIITSTFIIVKLSYSGYESFCDFIQIGQNIVKFYVITIYTSKIQYLTYLDLYPTFEKKVM